jgi:hypothetical protein
MQPHARKSIVKFRLIICQNIDYPVTGCPSKGDKGSGNGN